MGPRHVSRVTIAARRSGIADRAMDLVRHVAKHMFTAADGETYAVGRLLGVVLLLFGLAAPSAVAVYHAGTHKDVPMEEWVSFINAMVLYIPALSGSVVGLITLTNNTEPKPPVPTPPKTDAGEEPA